MRTINSVFSAILASFLGILASACRGNSNAPSKISVDKDVAVAIYSTTDSGGMVDTISPCLLEETVHISELLHYSNNDRVTMPFNFSDTVRYAEITKDNIEKRIAVSINGQVVSTPVVKMELNNGACSVELDDAQIADLFPNINTKKFKATNN